MEYNYDTVLINVFEKYKLEIIQLFQKYFDENRTFEYSIDEIRKNLVSERCDTIIYKNESIFSNCVYLFNHFETTFQKGSSISKIIETDILTSFNKINLDANPELYNYSFEEFVDDLIVYDTLGRIEKRLYLNKELYQLFFELNNYEEFTLEPFEGEVTNSELYKNLHRRLNPNYELNFIETVIPETVNQKLTDAKTLHSNNLSQVEKYFLFYIMCSALNKPNDEVNSNKFNLPSTELVRLSTIIYNNDLDCFDKKKYRDTEQYIILNKGIKHFDVKDRIIFINNLIEKLKDLMLPKTTIYIKEILNIEHNKIAKKQIE